jgi:hypothetical protein
LTSGDCENRFCIFAYGDGFRTKVFAQRQTCANICWFLAREFRAVPDVLVWYCGKSITVEMKSRRGQCSRSQRAVREALLRAGAMWWVCRSGPAAMWALYESGVPFRTIVHEDGTQECWHDVTGCEHHVASCEHHVAGRDHDVAGHNCMQWKEDLPADGMMAAVRPLGLRRIPLAALLLHYNKKSYLQIKNYAAFMHALVDKSRVRLVFAIKHEKPKLLQQRTSTTSF